MIPQQHKKPMNDDLNDALIFLLVVIFPAILFSIFVAGMVQLGHKNYIETYNLITKCRQSVSPEKADTVCGKLPGSNQ